MTEVEIDLDHYAKLKLPTALLPLYLYDMMQREGMQTDITAEILEDACKFREKELFSRSNETREHNRQYKNFVQMMDNGKMDTKELLIIINHAKRLIIQRAIDDQENGCES